MPESRCVLVVLGAFTALAAPAFAASARPPAARSTSLKHALLTSRELWATVDVCNPPDQRNWVGIRGSMPGDGHPHDRMYMSFRLQYLSSSTKQWVDAASARSPFLAVGTGASTRQDGTSFKLVRGTSPFTLRGVVDFQWRRGGTVLWSA